jgi:SPP1 family predicted phage head-tail adaptor
VSNPVYNSGEMDRLLTFKSPTKGRGTAGGIKLTWTTVTELSWAKWLPGSSAEVINALARYSELSGVLLIRYRSDLLTTWRVTMEDGVQYEILGKPIEIGRQEFQALIVKTVTAP